MNIIAFPWEAAQQQLCFVKLHSVWLVVAARGCAIRWSRVRRTLLAMWAVGGRVEADSGPAWVGGWVGGHGTFAMYMMGVILFVLMERKQSDTCWMEIMNEDAWGMNILSWIRSHNWHRGARVGSQSKLRHKQESLPSAPSFPLQQFSSNFLRFRVSHERNVRQSVE